MSTLFQAEIILTNDENKEVETRNVSVFSFGNSTARENLSRGLYELLNGWVEEEDTPQIVQEALNAKSECWTWAAEKSEGASFYYSIQDAGGETLYRLHIELY